jgi:membrane protease YdiL (CAAX protease family)
VVENLVDDRLILDAGNHFGFASALWTNRYIYIEHPLQALCPGHRLVPLLRSLIITLMWLGSFATFGGRHICESKPLRYIRLSFLKLPKIIGCQKRFKLLLMQAVIILYEELIWRVFLSKALQALLPVLGGVLLSALLFWFVHAENRSISGHSIEFFFFSITLVSLYIYTNSLLMVWTIHACRNLLILSYHWKHDATDPATK